MDIKQIQGHDYRVARTRHQAHLGGLESREDFDAEGGGHWYSLDLAGHPYCLDHRMRGQRDASSSGDHAGSSMDVQSHLKSTKREKETNNCQDKHSERLSQKKNNKKWK